MDKDYKGIIWTNHALTRMQQRGIEQGDAWVTWRRPDQSRKGSQKGTWIYYKTLGNETIEVVAKQNEKKEWIILSVWSKHTDKSLKSSDGDTFLDSIKKLFGG